MTCDRYLELLALRPDGALTREEERELAEHLARCPDCRAAESRLAAIHTAFSELEDLPAPEGFAQGVMVRIQAETSEQKVIPLFKRPQFRALAGLAACLVLAVGLYSARQPKDEDAEDYVMIVQNFNGEADYSVPQGRAAAGEDDTLMIATYDEAIDLEAAPVESVERFADNAILILDRMPEGAEALIPEEPEAVVVAYNVATGEEGYQWWTDGASETLDQIERLAIEQDISAERSSAPAEEAEYDLVLLEPAH